jgi:hypothetical protein
MDLEGFSPTLSMMPYKLQSPHANEIRHSTSNTARGHAGAAGYANYIGYSGAGGGAGGSGAAAGSSTANSFSRTTNRTRKWTKEEDQHMVRLVAEMGIKRWGDIGKCLVGRTGKQCRERWHNQLDPSINKNPWTQEEEDLLIRLHDQYGNKWAEIAKLVPGRTDNTIKNHWNSAMRRLQRQTNAGLAAGAGLAGSSGAAVAKSKAQTNTHPVKVSNAHATDTGFTSVFAPASDDYDGRYASHRNSSPLNLNMSMNGMAMSLDSSGGTMLDSNGVLDDKDLQRGLHGMLGFTSGASSMANTPASARANRGLSPFERSVATRAILDESAEWGEGLQTFAMSDLDPNGSGVDALLRISNSPMASIASTDGAFAGFFKENAASVFIGGVSPRNSLGGNALSHTHVSPRRSAAADERARAGIPNGLLSASITGKDGHPASSTNIVPLPHLGTPSKGGKLGKLLANSSSCGGSGIASNTMHSTTEIDAAKEGEAGNGGGSMAAPGAAPNTGGTGLQSSILQDSGGSAVKNTRLRTRQMSSGADGAGGVGPSGSHTRAGGEKEDDHFVTSGTSGRSATIDEKEENDKNKTCRPPHLRRSQTNDAAEMLVLIGSSPMASTRSHDGEDRFPANDDNAPVEEYKGKEGSSGHSGTSSSSSSSRRGRSGSDSSGGGRSNSNSSSSHSTAASQAAPLQMVIETKEEEVEVEKEVVRRSSRRGSQVDAAKLAAAEPAKPKNTRRVAIKESITAAPAPTHASSSSTSAYGIQLSIPQPDFGTASAGSMNPPGSSRSNSNMSTGATAMSPSGVGAKRGRAPLRVNTELANSSSSVFRQPLANAAAGTGNAEAAANAAGPEDKTESKRATRSTRSGSVSALSALSEISVLLSPDGQLSDRAPKDLKAGDEVFSFLTNTAR